LAKLETALFASLLVLHSKGRLPA